MLLHLFHSHITQMRGKVYFNCPRGAVLFSLRLRRLSFIVIYAYIKSLSNSTTAVKCEVELTLIFIHTIILYVFENSCEY